MRKILLSAVALVATMSVNAQEFCAFNADENADFAAIGLSSDKIAVVGGTVIGKTASVVAKIGADDDYKSSSIGTISVGDASINGGLQGNTNPKDADGGVPSSTLVAPAGGAFFVFEVAKDGYLYVFQNSSSNKSYTVFEEGEAIGYVFSAYWKNGVLPTGAGVYTYELKGAGEYNWLKEAGITSVLWPEQYIIGETYNLDETVNAKGETGKGYGDAGLGVIKFPVFKDCKYIVNANGSKMTASGFYFDETGDAKVSITVDDAEVVILGGNGGGSAVSNDIWTNTATDVVNWNGIYRFALEGHDGANECIAEIPQATWDKMMTTPFYLQLQPQADWYQIRITNGWWDVEWVGGDIQPGNELLSDNGDGTLTLKVDLAGQPNLVATLLEKHLLFTGSGYMPIKLFFADAANIHSVKNTTAQSNVIYNLSGQQVDKNYKGIVIINGKKMMQK